MSGRALAYLADFTVRMATRKYRKVPIGQLFGSRLGARFNRWEFCKGPGLLSNHIQILTSVWESSRLSYMGTKAERVDAFAREHTFVRPRDLRALSVSHSHLWHLTRAGKVERVARGLYRAKGTEISEYETLLEVFRRVPHGVLCLSSALRFHELTTENPFEVWIALERGTWTPKMKYPPIRVVHLSKAPFEFGIDKRSVAGGKLRVYSPAKTVADCFKFRSRIGTETAIEALRSCIREKKASVEDLWRAAKICRVSNVMRPYMESLA